MKKLLHIIATPRGDESNTMRVSNFFLKTLMKKNPKLIIEVVNTFDQQMITLSNLRIEGKYELLENRKLVGELEKSWEGIFFHIENFLSADAYLISTPMWNFSIPYTLKQYIDIIVQPKYLFRYTDDGIPQGLVLNKKMIVITSSGGDYSTNQMSSYNFLEPYLRTIFGFVGITDISFLSAHSMNIGDEIKKHKMSEHQEKAKELALQF
ncbi:MAG: NAD(P)H-dependent oxidoreductase [Oligoflexia bacterium]|nr:NAD(P)H-dependent oxidoreductase [Oligoflexia bacterium]